MALSTVLGANMVVAQALVIGGGSITISGGNAGGAGNNNGGSITLQVRSATGTTGSSGSVLIPYVGSGSTTIFQVGGNNAAILTVDNSSNHVDIGAPGSCTSFSGKSLCCPGYCQWIVG